MDPSPAAVRAAEAELGDPGVVTWEQEILPWELDLIERVCGEDRHHDVTVFVVRGTDLALVRKPSDPPGVWWAPAGGVHPGEGLAEAGVREVYEEAGVRSTVDRYLHRIEVEFTSGTRRRPWTSHVLAASWVGREPDPVDTREVAAAAWIGTAAFAAEVAPLMAAAGWGRFAYRLRMARLVFAELGLPGDIETPALLQCNDRRGASRRHT